MSWLFSQALVEAYSEANSSDGAPFVPSNGTATPQAYLLPDRMTGSWSRFPSGMTCGALTASHGEALLTWFLAGSHAKTSPLLEKGQESTESAAECGNIWPESLAKYDPATFSWKTRQCLLFEDSGECLETWPKWGTTRGGECWAESPWDFVAVENDCGSSLMRPIASDGIRHRFKVAQLIRKNHQDGNLTEQLARVHQVKLTPLASEILMDWPETWSALKPLETDKFQQWLRSHGKL
jgi:hypothetical protein